MTSPDEAHHFVKMFANTLFGIIYDNKSNNINDFRIIKYYAFDRVMEKLNNDNSFLHPRTLHIVAKKGRLHILRNTLQLMEYCGYNISTNNKRSIVQSKFKPQLHFIFIHEEENNDRSFLINGISYNPITDIIDHLWCKDHIKIIKIYDELRKNKYSFNGGYRTDDIEELIQFYREYGLELNDTSQ